jgi:formylglycine-generating enzyme required for sulfatase activity
MKTALQQRINRKLSHANQRLCWAAACILVWLPVAGQQTMPGGPPREFTNSIGMKFVLIEPGTFLMGSDSGEADEKPVHEVTLSKGFYLQTTEVTQAQWQAVMGYNPSFFKGPDRPVESVSWDDVQKFLEKLNAREKDTRYRLPAEAEWEHACRAGGQEPDAAQNLGEVAWWDRNSEGGTHPVGQKRSNAWGLYDMRGNVWEYVQDWYGGYSPERTVDPQGPASGVNRVLRGGAWCTINSSYFRCAHRSYMWPADTDLSRGFRCARSR